MTILLPTLISCDEAGFTGNRLLDLHQPYFAYASTDIDTEEAAAIIAEARCNHGLGHNELKSAALLRRERGRRALVDILVRMKDRYIVTLYDKKLTLCGKFFEYIYEPVLQRNNILFYNNNLHRYVAMMIYMLLESAAEPAEEIAEQFQAFMRSFDPGAAPVLFLAEPGGKSDELFNMVLRFTRGYKDEILEETRNLQLTGDTGKWVLDVSISALWSHLAAWGRRHELIKVACDSSKPLAAQTPELQVMINRPERVTMQAFGKERTLTWNMAGPVEFVDSRSHAAVQLADIAAGTIGFVARYRNLEEASLLGKHILPHLHTDCIMPDYDVLDLEGDEAPVNWLVLYELAQRADIGADPLNRMAEFYAAARKTLPLFRSRTRIGV